MADLEHFDVVIVGGGISGSLVARELGLAGRRVLILEAGEPNPPSVEAYMEQFYLSRAKTPGAPYPPAQGLVDDQPLVPDPSTQNVGKPEVLTLGKTSWQDAKQSYLDQQGPLPFSSTYERVGGGTTRHWLGTSLRFLPNDFRMAQAYPQSGLPDWPISYDELSAWYDRAEVAIGVSAAVQEQSYLGITFTPGYNYPMKAITPSLVDQAVAAGVAGETFENQPVTVTGTPAGRNSQPYQERRVCAGNTNCIPICPIQAKYDASVTLNQALQTGNVQIRYRTVVTSLSVGDDGLVSGVSFVEYAQAQGPQTGAGTVTADRYVVAAHAIETVKILLNSKLPPALAAKSKGDGIANCSDQVGRNLMDHPLYLEWAMAKDPVYGYRGPLATSGIESLRDGVFRTERAAFRIEIGNEGWNFSAGDPWTTLGDFVDGSNDSQSNPGNQALFGTELVAALNRNLTRQFRIGFLVEQSPESSNRVTLSDQVDHLGIRRPRIDYNLSEYTKNGFRAAKQVAAQVFARMGATRYTKPNLGSAAVFDLDGEPTQFFGAGHVVGTYRMGDDPSSSVVDRYQRSHDHENLFLIGDGVFPTITTANPTLTIAALSVWAGTTLVNDFASPESPGSKPVRSPALSA